MVYDLAAGLPLIARPRTRLFTVARIQPGQRVSGTIRTDGATVTLASLLLDVVSTGGQGSISS